MRHFSRVENELAFIDPAERSTSCTLGQIVELLILELRQPDSSTCIACTCDPGVLEHDKEDFRTFILLITSLPYQTEGEISYDGLQPR